ncbi:MAG: fumarate hydratase [Alphaproteobacteria bacterium]|nr:fumarate hydratase [Alphaproteobacteria bacterium]
MCNNVNNQNVPITNFNANSDDNFCEEDSFACIFPTDIQNKKNTKFRKLSGNDNFVFTDCFRNKEITVITPKAIKALIKESFKDISHLLRPSHLQQLRNILDDTESSDNDKFIATELLKNATISAKKTLPMCQDTGTAIVMGWKGKNVWIEEQDPEYSEKIAITKGIKNAYSELNLRYSQMSATSMYEEKNTNNNLPAQIDLYSGDGNANEYEFLLMAKGGGSANKTSLFQETRALLSPDKLISFLEEKIKDLGSAACPPYHIAVVIGGTSAETTLKTVKLASARYLDHLPTSGNKYGQAFRDLELEDTVKNIANKTGIGAQFGGKHFCLDARVIRLPRHGASLPIAIGISCVADRQIIAKITPEGLFVEKLENHPEKYLLEHNDADNGAISVDVNQPIKKVLQQLSAHPVGTRLSISGDIIVARDIAHAKLNERLLSGKELPEYFKNNPVYYAGPAKTPKGLPSGSFGPTTAGRMDSYVNEFQKNGGSMIMIAKGNRSEQVIDACKNNGGFYLGSIGGAAAKLAQSHIKKIEALEFPELGMEAIWKIRVENFPAFIIIDDKGNNFYSQT